MKKFINNTLKSLALSSLLFAASCEQEYQAVDLVSDVAWFTSDVGGDYTFSVGDVLSVMDASQGLKSHKWIIEEGSQFMVNGFDVKADDIEGQIDPNKTLESDELVENVIFLTPGSTTVTLRNAFYEWVRSHDSDVTEATLDLENQEWVWEKTFNIEVYGALEPAFSASIEGNKVLDFLAGDAVPTNQSKWAVVNLEVGQQIVFTDNTTSDRPDGRTWTVSGSAEGSSTAASASFSFNTVGTYSGFTLAVTRANPSATSKVTLPIIIQVEASTDPLEVKALEVDVDNPSVVLLTANGSFYEADAAEAANFTLSVVDAAGAAIDGISVSSVEVDGSNPSELQIVLSERLYPGEIPTLAYSGSSGIFSSDGRELCSFSAMAATNELVSANIIDATVSNFGESSGTIQNAGWYTEAESVTNNLVIKTESPDGDGYSIMFDIQTSFTAAKLYLMHYNTVVQAPAGSYIICYDMWIPSSCTTLDSGTLSYTLGYKNGTNAWVDLTPAALYPTVEEGRGKWVKMEYELTLSDAIVDGKLRFAFPAASVPLGTQFYIDNVELYSSRPTE